MCLLKLPGGRLCRVSIRKNDHSQSFPADSAINDIEIKQHGYWGSFLTWLHQYPSPGGDQQDWWAFNGLAFRLGDLPKELRLCIYKQVIGPYVWPHMTRKVKGSWFSEPLKTSYVRMFDPRKHRGADWRDYIGSHQFSFNPNGDPPLAPSSLPLVSKMVNEDFKEAIWKHAFKHFTDKIEFCRLIPEIEYRYGYNALRLISLESPNAHTGLYTTEVGLKYDRDSWAPHRQIEDHSYARVSASPLSAAGTV